MPHESVTKQRAVDAQRRTNGDIDVRTHADVLRTLLAYAYAAPDSAELSRAVGHLQAVLPEGGFAAVFEHDERVQHQLRDSLQQPVSVVWWVPQEALPLTVTSLQVARRDARQPAYPVYGGDWRVAFWFTVASVMQGTMHLLARCRGCGQRFVRIRRQVFCTKACGQRVRSRAWHAAHRPEAAERKHDAYVKRRRRTHPKAKIPRRPRLQRIATEGGTGRVKAPQVRVAPTKNARQSSQRKRRA